MPLDLAAALRSHLLDRFPPDRDYPRSAFRDPAMPPLVAAFLSRALDRWLEIERDGLRSDWFDFDAPSVRDAEKRFFGVLAETARVPANAWGPTLGGAVDLVVRFLTVPARALTDALFEGESDPLPTTQLRERLRLFAAYLYFPEVAAAYLDKKQLDTLDPDTLFDLLDRIDRRIVREYNPDDWLALLEPLYALARTVPDFDGVPASLLQRFFRAKGYSAVADSLEPHVGSSVDEDTLRQLLAAEIRSADPTVSAKAAAVDAVVAEAAAAEPVVAEAAPRDDTEDVPTVEALSLDPAPVLPADASPSEREIDGAEEPGSGEAVPLWQRFAHDVDEDVTEAGDDGDGSAAPLWKRFAVEPGTALPDAGPAAPAARVPDAPAARAVTAEPLAPNASESVAAVEARVLGNISGGGRARFVKHIFRGDERAYAAVLRSLDGTETWTEAAQVIARDVFRPYKVNIYGEHAVAFTDAVEARFRS